MTFTALLKSVRNAWADGAASSVCYYPFLEPLYILCGRLIDPIPLVRTFYRRGNETLVRNLLVAARRHRWISIGNVRFIFDISDFTVGGWVFQRRLFEPRTTEFVLKDLRPGQTFVDVGANRGYYSMLAASRVGDSGRVIAFEPNPTVMAELEAHIRLNGFERRVFCSTFALAGRADDNAEFFLSTCPLNSGLSSLSPAAELLQEGSLSYSRTIRVRAQTMDQWAESFGLSDPIDILKIDVEGAENLVLQGMAKTLDQAPPHKIIIETTPNSLAHLRLLNRGYKANLLDRMGRRRNILFTHSRSLRR